MQGWTGISGVDLLITEEEYELAHTVLSIPKLRLGCKNGLKDYDPFTEPGGNRSIRKSIFTQLYS